MWRIEEQNQSDFVELVEAAYAGYSKYNVFYYKKHLDYLYHTVYQFNNNNPISIEDIQQQLRLIWIELVKEYEKNSPRIHIRQYLIRRSVWALRDWLKDYSNIVSHYQFKPVQCSVTVKFKPFDIDLNFLFYGSTHPLLQNLSPYQRYILYLKYNKDKSISEISKKIEKDRSIVANDIKSLIKLLRSRTNVARPKDTEEPTRANA